MADLAVLDRWAEQRAVLAVGRSLLVKVISTASHGHQGADPAKQCRPRRWKCTGGIRPAGNVLGCCTWHTRIPDAERIAVRRCA